MYTHLLLVHFEYLPFAWRKWRIEMRIIKRANLAAVPSIILARGDFTTPPYLPDLAVEEISPSFPLPLCDCEIFKFSLLYGCR